MLPKVTSSYFQERQGVLRVASLLQACRLIWRETPNADVGIDGQVELVNDEGEATGSLIAVQVKSGRSYLVDGGDFWTYYPSEKHRRYWEHHALPVLLMLHDPDSDIVYWVDARRVLRSDQHSTQFIRVPKKNVLTEASRRVLFESVGSTGTGLMEPEALLRHMVLTASSCASFQMTYFDIFAAGLVDIGRKLFFSAGLCWDIAEYRNESGPIGMGGVEQAFMDAYLSLLAEQNIAIVDYSDFLIDIRDREMFPMFIAPLTSRGRAVRDLARDLGGVGAPYELTEGCMRISRDFDGPRRFAANVAVMERLRGRFSGEGSHR
jgi:hypothetical protein